MNLHKNTFGRTPACLYLTAYLNETGDVRTARTAAKILEAFRETMNSLVNSHLHTDEMKTRSFNRMIILMYEHAKIVSATVKDPLASELIRNILIGETKSWKTRAVKTSHVQRNLQRKTPQGVSVPMIKVIPRTNEETDQERISRLQHKSAAYLARKGKRNTLY